MREGHQREGDNQEGCREHSVANKEVIETEHSVGSQCNHILFMSVLSPPVVSYVPNVSMEC
jgi:hypothetical protein